MSEINYKALACEYLGVDESQITSYREQDKSIIVVVNCGIAGSPKLHIQKSDLEPKIEPEVQPAKRTTRTRGKK